MLVQASRIVCLAILWATALISRVDAQPDWCRYAKSNSERTICTTPRLWEIDGCEDGIFNAVRSREVSSRRQALEQQERAWVVERDRCGTDVACIRSSSITEPSTYYGSLRPCAPHWYSDPCGFSHLDVSLSIGTTGSHVPYESLMRARAVFTPDAARSGPGHPSSLSRENGKPPVLTSSNPLSTLHRRFTCVRLPASCLPGSCPDFSATLTTIAFDDSSLQWLGACS